MTHGETSAERPGRTGAAWTAETVAVLGAGGTMGFPMARNIVRAGIGVRVWNRSRDKAEPPAAEGATEWCAGLAGRYGVGFVDATYLTSAPDQAA
jgi:NAD(P)-dependent dehydrogenase (short-subunit alcohol dehydrogenase family)